MKKIPIIIDCDPGHDDAIAIMLALGSERIDLKAITTVAGNNTLEHTLNNTLKILSHLEITDIPVAPGASKFFFQPHSAAIHIHGESGLDGPKLEETTFDPTSMNAVDLIAKTVRESNEKITLVPMGPLTNIATFILSNPDLVSKIERISFMGGAALGGNVTACAEFNTWQDPEASYIVLNSGIPLTMAGLDMTFSALILFEEIEKFRKIGNKAGVLTAELLDFFGKFHASRGRNGVPMHDATAVAWVIDKELFETKFLNVTMDLYGDYTRGCTTTDGRKNPKSKPNCDVCFGIKREQFVNLLYDSISKLK